MTESIIILVKMNKGNEYLRQNKNDDNLMIKFCPIT